MAYAESWENGEHVTIKLGIGTLIPNSIHKNLNSIHQPWSSNVFHQSRFAKIPAIRNYLRKFSPGNNPLFVCKKPPRGQHSEFKQCFDIGAKDKVLSKRNGTRSFWSLHESTSQNIWKNSFSSLIDEDELIGRSSLPFLRWNARNYIQNQTKSVKVFRNLKPGPRWNVTFSSKTCCPELSLEQDKLKVFC